MDKLERCIQQNLGEFHHKKPFNDDVSKLTYELVTGS